MTSRILPFLFLAAACSNGSSDDRIARHAAGRLGVEAAELRVTTQTDLRGDRHHFYLVTRDGTPALVVVEADGGEIFDARTEGAFDRVARAEDAAARLQQHGAERVALWFGALGGGMCPSPTSTDAHFAKVERVGESVTIQYPAGREQICHLSLNGDGSVQKARVVASGPQADARRWHADANVN